MTSDSVVAPGVGDPAPDFTLADLTGTPVRLSQFRGQQTLILFWEPTCDYCRALLPCVVEWEVQPPREAPILLVVSTGDTRDNQEMGMSSTVLIEPSHRPVGNSFGAEGTPTAVLVDADGLIASPLAPGMGTILRLMRPGLPLPHGMAPNRGIRDHREHRAAPVPGPLIITGMGRSRSSLVTLFLGELGLDLGASLMEADHQNPEGYGEDLEAYRLHWWLNQALCDDFDESRRYLIAGWPEPPTHSPTEEHRAKMRRYLEDRAANAPPSSWAWGWKQPRSTAFLSSWLEVADAPKFLFLYRHPAGVVASLKRMWGNTYSADFALRIWQIYNRQLLDFTKLHRDVVLLVETSSFLSTPGRLVDLLADRFGYVAPVDLVGEARRAVFQNDLVRRSQLDDALGNDLPDGALALWEALNELSDMPAPR